MSGDIELGTLASVTNEVTRHCRRQAMNYAREFPARRNYRVHTVISAHCNDLRHDVDWQSLFSYEEH